jgi:catechol 1,2-dioxygenase
MRKQINASGQMSTDVRNESQLICDILGLESLVDEITFKLAAEAMDQPTATAILGPFWRKDAPKRSMGDSVIDKEMSDGDRTVRLRPLLFFCNHVMRLTSDTVDAWHSN